jgi:hypothetical protein
LIEAKEMFDLMAGRICGRRLIIADEATARRERWRTHCHRMAEATQAIADRCESPRMIATYVELAATWIRMAGGPPEEAGGETYLH